jgi:hypothetical protein
VASYDVMDGAIESGKLAASKVDDRLDGPA